MGWVLSKVGFRFLISNKLGGLLVLVELFRIIKDLLVFGFFLVLKNLILQMFRNLLLLCKFRKFLGLGDSLIEMGLID